MSSSIVGRNILVSNLVPLTGNEVKGTIVYYLCTDLTYKISKICFTSYIDNEVYLSFTEFKNGGNKKAVVHVEFDKCFKMKP